MKRAHLHRASVLIAVALASTLDWDASVLAGIKYTVTDLGTLGGRNSFAHDINNNGQVVGEADLSEGPVHAFLYSGGPLLDLGILDSRYTGSYAYGINDVGQIVGACYIDGGSVRAFLRSGGVMIDLGTFGGEDSGASRINNSGHVVGGANTPGDEVGYAYKYSGGSMTDLGTLGGPSSQAYDINNSGQIVGVTYLSDIEESTAFICDGGPMANLNAFIDPASHWTLLSANAINSSGQIVGDGINAAGQYHAFLLTPIPEPASLTLLTIGGFAILVRRRNTQRPN